LSEGHPIIRFGKEFFELLDKDISVLLVIENQSINTFITRHGTEARATVQIMPKQREMS